MIKNPTYRGTVYPWHCDHVGHMNVMWYVGKFDEATWNMFSDIGLSSAYLRDHARGMAAVEQHLTYARELRAGDVLAINSKLIEAKSKLIRFAHQMVDAASGDICATSELTAVHMDITERRATTFGDELFEKLKQSID